ncbi:hypothetical protein M3936_19290 [Sutcliffiella horikoshii]|uniref:hypothetical protein n=1 Tax=Sutcliffiella horikoshii TaxID=79883 RepID=UPI00203B5BE2|nr:hypothetical protein [Sutcliffiella horikoshii]MCM3619718.1 hypothetical protein [Sutcliffiella horikoshii]
MRWPNIFICSLISIALVGCNNKGLTSEIDRVESLKKELEKEVQELEEVKEERMEAYKEMERPVEEIIDNMDKENMRVVESKEVKNLIMNKDKFTSESEFSKVMAYATYNFFTMNWTAVEYYEFLDKHSTSNFKQNVLGNKEQAVQMFNNVQGILKERKELIPIDYEITEVILSKSGRSGYFYRKDTTTKGDDAYYIISIIHEDGAWKFDDEKPSVPYEKIDDNFREEDENSTDTSETSTKTEEEVNNDNSEE